MVSQVSGKDIVTPDEESYKSVVILAIVSVTIVLLTCILACSATAIIFIYNVAW